MKIKILIFLIALALISGCVETQKTQETTKTCENVQIQPYCSGANAVTVKNLGVQFDKLTVKVYRITETIDTYEEDGLETNEYTAVDLGIGAMTKLKVIPAFYDKTCDEKAITIDNGC